MNLIHDAWIEVERRSGRRERIAPIQLTADAEDPVVEVLAPRPDFRGALYQFLIALLQTACAPRDLSEWKERWTEPLTASQLQEALEPYASAFELNGTEAAFMQDFDLLSDVEPRIISRLLIDAPSENALKENKDHFHHRGEVEGICTACVTAALITFQINAPEGGPGFRVSVRGGGPLTTLLVPQDSQATLWHKLWMNVLPQSNLRYTDSHVVGEVLPWMLATRTSGKNGVGDTTPETVSPLQVYWSMSSRIRIDFKAISTGICDICGEPCERLIRQYRTLNYGINYTGAWLHPLTPYNLHPNGEKVPISCKGRDGESGYRHWLGLTLGNDQNQPAAAQVVAHFNRSSYKLPENTRQARLWCFGYDMESAKACCWYDSTLPLHTVTPDLQEDLVRAVKALIDVASEAADELHKQVMKAWFKPSKKGQPAGKRKEEPAVQLGFWQASETKFYSLLERVVKVDLKDAAMLAPLYSEWLFAVRGLALSQFDAWVLGVPIEEMDMKRVVKAQAELDKYLTHGKAVKALWKIVNTNEKERA